MNRYWLGVAIGVLGLALLIKIDTRPIMTCAAKQHESCVFNVMLSEGDRVCLQEIGVPDFLACKDGEAGLAVLLRVRPPSPGDGAIVLEAITINTHLEPPLLSRPASTLGFLPDLEMPSWQNNLQLTAKRIRWRWGS